jgi:SAM-dependent MidA family methyltransferase
MSLADLASTDNAALKDIIAARIAQRGPISFAEFMALALYHPVHGYYFAGDPARDYQTSPNVHPVFGAVLGRQLADFWRLLGRPERFDVLEAGAGNGRLAADVTRWLRTAEPGCFAALRYLVQDLTLPAGQTADRLTALGLDLTKVEVRLGLPDAGEIEGCILSNELLDAFPVHRVKVRQGRLQEVYVAFEQGRFTEAMREPAPAVGAHFERLHLLPGEECVAEVNLDALDWMRRAAQALRRGYMLTLDYGYAADALYAPWRKQGTLLTFYRHTSGEDPYIRVGRQDITASVDFTSLVRTGEEAGLRTFGLTAQSEFLAALGIGEALAQRPDSADLEAYYALRRSVIELTDPTGLGRISVLVQGKDVPDTAPAGLSTARRDG